jgi:hypothetical protein
MTPRNRSAFRPWIAVLGLLLFAGRAAEAQNQAPPANNPPLAEPITKGLRVFTCGHSFHVWVPGIVADLSRLAEIPDHVQLGVSSIGGSRVIQHWDILELAVRLTGAHPLRAYDAIQLATALRLRAEYESAGLLPPVFVSSDQILNQVAAAEGLVVDDPSAHP